MYKLLIVFALFNLTTKVNTVSVKIDGIIDLGPNWNIQYSINPVDHDSGVYLRINDETIQKVDQNTTPVLHKLDDNEQQMKSVVNDSNISDSTEDKITDTTVPEAGTETTIKKNNPITTTILLSKPDVNVEIEPNSEFDLGSLIKINVEEPTTVTNKPKVYTEEYINGIFQTPRLVKDDPKVLDFIKDIKQNSEVFFSTIKTKVVDVRSKNKIDFLFRSYNEKFGEFLNETMDQKILTRLGTQKVILNIIDTSNSIMKRLINYLIGDMQKKGSLRYGVTGVLEGELLSEEKNEYLNACHKFGVCRTKDRFSLFAAEFLTEILSGDDSRVKIASDSFTEVFRYADFSRFGDKKLKKQIVEAMDWIERIEGNQLRPLLMSLKNMLVSKNKPLVVMPDAYGTAMNKSVAFLDLVDAIDDKLPPTLNTIKEWNESLSAVREWIAGLRNDATDIVSKFSAHFLIKAAGRMKGKMVDKIQQNLEILFKTEPVVSEEI